MKRAGALAFLFASATFLVSTPANIQALENTQEVDTSYEGGKKNAQEFADGQTNGSENTSLEGKTGIRTDLPGEEQLDSPLADQTRPDTNPAASQQTYPDVDSNASGQVYPDADFTASGQTQPDANLNTPGQTRPDTNLTAPDQAQPDTNSAASVQNQPNADLPVSGQVQSGQNSSIQTRPGVGAYSAGSASPEVQTNEGQNTDTPATASPVERSAQAAIASAGDASSAAEGWSSVIIKENDKDVVKWRFKKGGQFYTNQIVTINGAKYAFDKNGYMLVGANKVSGNEYFFTNTGDAPNIPNSKYGQMLKKAWVKISDSTYYFYKESGIRNAEKVGLQKIDGTYYFLDKKGKILTGFQSQGGKTYYFDAKGPMKEYVRWVTIAGKKYYFHETKHYIVQKLGWQTISGKKYYFNTKGNVVTGWNTIGTKTYYFGAKGVMFTGLKKIGGKRYFFRSGGALLKSSWKKIGDKKYYFQADGSAAAGGQYTIDGKTYCFGAGGVMKTGWRKVNGKNYFFKSNGTLAKNEWLKVNDKWNFVNNDGQRVTGWQYINGYKYYFNSNGELQQDLRSIYKANSYKLTINRTHCVVTVFASDGNNGYIIPIKSFACSVGLPDTPTPTGTYRTTRKERWHELMGPSYGQYCTNIVAGIWFHSVAGVNMTSYNISAGAYNMLGSPASHGCVRLNVIDAKWIYDNCPVGTTVQIFDSSSVGPFDKPATIKIPDNQNWDPTDPAVKK